MAAARCSVRWLSRTSLNSAVRMVRRLSSRRSRRARSVVRRTMRRIVQSSTICAISATTKILTNCSGTPIIQSRADSHQVCSLVKITSAEGIS